MQPSPSAETVRPCPPSLRCSMATSTLTCSRGQLKMRGSPSAEGYPSGQREQTVNLPAYAFVGSNLHQPGEREA